MNRRLVNPSFFTLTLLAIGCWLSQSAKAQVSLPSYGTPVTQDFNTLANSGTNNTVVPAGWSFVETGTNANTVYTPGTGSSNAGDTYSYGAAASTERAFGELRSGSVNTILGANFVNNTGGTISSLAITYHGEQWRLGTLGRVDRMDFQYSIDATSLSIGTWIDFDLLDFTAPTTTGTVGALDGNAAANSITLTSTIPALSIANAANFWIRWTDLDAASSDDGLSADDFSITGCPTVSCAGNLNTCINTSPFALTGGSPAGGTYSGTGVSGGVFNPSVAGVGTHTITYNFGGCASMCSYSITVDANPSATIGTVPDVCTGTTSASLPYSGLTGGANQYSIIYSSEAIGAGFVNVTNAALPASPITLTVPASAPSFTYNANVSFRNSTSTCQSVQYSFSVRVMGCLASPSMEWVLLNDNNEVHGTCVSHSDCDNNVICYALKYIPNHTGKLTSYTTGFFANCTTNGNPVIDTSNRSCVMDQGASSTNNLCASSGSVLFNSSASGPQIDVTLGVPVYLQQVCFTIPAGQTVNVSADPITGLTTSITVGNPPNQMFFTETPAYTTLAINRNAICAILPLRWLSFRATKYDDLMSQLEWKTTDETNNAYFEVQRSIDFGHTWQAIGKVEAATDPGSVNTYTFIDRYASVGKNLYRIMQVDNDARLSYSSIEAVTFTSNKFMVQVWPNPASADVNVNIHAAAGSGYISLYDLNGRLILTRHFEAGESFETFHVFDLLPGVYTLSVEDGTNRQTEKIVVTR
ncbi:MAG: T9SS type A sorting domain-containing protein [Saprospiraceae bacterium]